MKTKIIIIAILSVLIFYKPSKANDFIVEWSEVNTKEISGFRVYLTDDHDWHPAPKFVSTTERRWVMDLLPGAMHYVNVVPISAKTGTEGTPIIELSVILRPLNHFTVK